MDDNRLSEWHGGGTPAPEQRERGGPPTEIRLWHATDLVPQRATRRRVDSEKAQFIYCFVPLVAHNGTQWHDRPRESARDLWRAR